MSERAHPTLIIGLTGGIGSGKSTVADALVARGAALVDTDQIAHALTAPGGTAIEPIRQAFGDAVIAPDGRMDRAAMRERAFSDPQARTLLVRALLSCRESGRIDLLSHRGRLCLLLHDCKRRLVGREHRRALDERR